MSSFKLTSPFKPTGDQPGAITALAEGLRKGNKFQVLLGVTGSGKTFTIANVVAQVQRPTLVIAPNKTLAAQLYTEFKALFPENAVEYFVSYYDYYQPEAYIPASDTYIQKDSSINDMIDKLRHSATRSVLSRNDVLVVASVSCIYGLGAPEDYLALRIDLKTGTEMSRDKLLAALVDIQYERNDVDFHRGVFRVRGDRVEIFPAYEEDRAIRVEFFGDEIDSLGEIDPLRGQLLRRFDRTSIFPASHYVTQKQTRYRAIKAILAELKTRVAYFREENKLIEAQRIEERTQFDLEMMQEIGYCNGIENYARHLTGRKAGQAPPTLLDYYPEDFLVIIDESHIGIPQLHAMYKGDRSRKKTLVGFGFRLPSALDNRPLQYDEFYKKIDQVICVSATPADYEIEQAGSAPIEQVARPTGLLDPTIDVRPAKNQVDDLLEEIRTRVEHDERILITTLTKRMAEDLTEYYEELGIRVRYLHSDIKTMERMEIIRDLRLGAFDVLIGINLLREGLDIPEVSLVAIIDADKEGFLRSERALIQTCGRAARNVAGTVIMYADTITGSMQKALNETERRRNIQTAYNAANDITPKTIQKDIPNSFLALDNARHGSTDKVAETVDGFNVTEQTIDSQIRTLEKEMNQAAKDLEFERAAVLRDQIKKLRKLFIFEL